MIFLVALTLLIILFIIRIIAEWIRPDDPSDNPVERTARDDLAAHRYEQELQAWARDSILRKAEAKEQVSNTIMKAKKWRE